MFHINIKLHWNYHQSKENGTIRFLTVTTLLGAIVFGFNLYRQEAVGYLSSLVMAFFSKLTCHL